jgi:uncharacterized protein YdhG (YjbR/CyaY superfamily)
MKKDAGFSDAEKAAMKARARELKLEAKREATRAEGEAELLAAVEAMPEPSKGIGSRLHRLISEAAPDLIPRTWYGMPAYSNADGRVVCFFRGAEKFKERYLTFGFNDVARVDDGVMWPIAYAILELSAKEEAVVTDLIKRAVG